MRTARFCGSGGGIITPSPGYPTPLGTRHLRIPYPPDTLPPWIPIPWISYPPPDTLPLNTFSLDTLSLWKEHGTRDTLPSLETTWDQ